MNHKQLPLALEVLAEAEITAHIIGEAGIGKSFGVYQHAERIGGRVIEVRVGLMADAGDLSGIQEFIKCLKTGKNLASEHVLPSWFMALVENVEDAAHNAQPIILFFDELTRGHKDILQACFEIVYDRSLKGKKMRKNVMIVAASNPTTDDYAGSMEFSDDAFSDRFCHIKLEPTVEEFMQYGKTRGKIDNVILDFIGEYPQMLDKEHKPWSLDFVNPSRRSWDRLNKVLTILDKKGPEYKEIELELMFGIIGEKAALAFRSFRDSYIKSIKAADVLESYTTNPMVKNSVLGAIDKNRPDMLATMNDELVALLGKLSGLTQLQADNIAAVVTDLPVELAYALVQKLTTACGDVSNAIRTIDGKSPGLWGHKVLVDRIEYIKAERMKIKALAKKADTSKKKKTEEIPF